MEPKNEKPHPVSRIRARLGAEHRNTVTADVLPEDSGYRGTVVVLGLEAAERVADLLDLLARLRGEDLVDATSLDLARQAGGGKVWTVRMILRRSIPTSVPNVGELIASDALRILDADADKSVVEIAAPANVSPSSSHEWATRTANALHDLGFDAAPAPAWGGK